MNQKETSAWAQIFVFFFRPKVSYHCKGQDTHHPPAYVTDAVISKMQDDWDLKELQKGNEETLKGSGAFI